jgi:hypothetical protein
MNTSRALAGRTADLHWPHPCHERPHWIIAIRHKLRVIVNKRTACSLNSVVPYYAWILLDLCSTLPSAHEYRRSELLITSEIKLKHLSTALMILVLMQGAVRFMTVRQLHP